MEAYLALLPDASLGVCLFLRWLRGLGDRHGHVIIGVFDRKRLEEWVWGVTSNFRHF